MKLAIVGSREFNDYSLMKEKYLEVSKDYDIDCIVSGGARGADSLAEQIAKDFDLELKVFPAEWNKFGRGAGMMRNTTIVENSDIILAFPIGKSVGTWDTIRKAKNSNKKVFIS